MAAVHDVLRYLLERTPCRTQEEHDQIAALIDLDENGEPAASEEPSTKDKSKKGDPK